jgi:hypothetical protein
MNFSFPKRNEWFSGDLVSTVRMNFKGKPLCMQPGNFVIFHPSLLLIHIENDVVRRKRGR